MDSSVKTQAAAPVGQLSFREFADALPQMVWSTLPDGSHDYYNAQWYAFTGVDVGSTDGAGWNEMFHPDDQELAWERWKHSLQTGEPYEIEYRLRHYSGVYRWTLGRALPIRDGAGQIVRWVGTCTDIDEQKKTAEQNEILSRELSHRIKNIFAVLNGLIGLSARHFPHTTDFAQELKKRVAALGRAHDHVRPHSAESAPETGASTLKTLLSEVLSPYPALDEGRLTVEGDDRPVDDRGATPIGLVFHELATNASKYGALSTADGLVRIVAKTRDDGSIHLMWEERNGPRLHKEPERLGFGSRLTEMSVVQQLGGKLEREWAEDGLRVLITLPGASLSRF